jgi:membrane fusion protein (multidrug efflux system)
LKKGVVAVAVGVVLAVSVVGVGKYLYFTHHYVKSNAFFVKSDTLKLLSFKLPGKIVYLKPEGASIFKGEPIAKLDTSELEKRRQEVVDKLSSLSHLIRSLILQQEELSREIKLKGELITAQMAGVRAKIAAQQAQLSQLKRDYDRFQRLYRAGRVAKAKWEEVETRYKMAQKGLEGLKAQLTGLKTQLKLVKLKELEVKRLGELIVAKKGELNATRQRLGIVDLKLRDSVIYSPIDGVIAKKFKKVGEVVGAGNRVVAVVNPKQLYGLVLLEETKLKGVKVGNRAVVHIDALDRDFPGVVSEILPVSAATFALVPRDFSSGEFTKLAQRFYVKIRFLHYPQGALVGMGGEVTIQKSNR